MKKSGLKLRLAGVLLTAAFAANCSGKTYSTFLQPFDLVFGNRSGGGAANSSVLIALTSATPLTPTRLRLALSKPVSLATGESAANYAITDANGVRLDVLAVTRDPYDSSVVYVDTSLQVAGTVYTITASNLVGVDGASLNSSANTASWNGPTNVDAVLPVISLAVASLSTQVDVTFSEALDATSAQLAGNYTLYGPGATGCSGGTVAVTAAVLNSTNFAKVQLTTASMGAGTYYLKATAVKDIWGNGATPATTCSPAFVYTAPAAPKVVSAVSQSPTSVLFSFDTAMTNNAALRTAANYVISNCATGSLTPASVAYPPAAGVSTSSTVLVIYTTSATDGTCKATITTGGITSANGNLAAPNNVVLFPYKNSATGTAPAVLSVGATSSGNVRVTFTEPIANPSAANFTFSPALTILGTFNCAATAPMGYCDIPTADQTTQSYSLTVSGVTDSAGTTITTTATAFTGDGKPYITAVIPIDSTTVRLQWSEPVTSAGIDAADFEINGGGPIAQSLLPAGATSSDVMTITSPITLVSGTTYTFKYHDDTPGNTVDLTGNATLYPVPSEQTITFVGPTFSSAPQVGSASAPSPTTIRITFNEALDNSTIDDARTTDYAISGGGCPLSSNITSATQVQAGVVQLVLSSGTAGPATCTVTVGAGNVKNIYGTAIAGTSNAATFSYTGTGTVDATPPTIVSAVALSSTQIQVFFSETVSTTGGAVGANSASNPSNYSFSPAMTTVPSIACSGAVCTIDVTGQTTATYTLTSGGTSMPIQDSAGVTMSSQSATFFGTGGSVAAPTLYMASLINPTTVELSFSEQMSIATAQTTANYLLSLAPCDLVSNSSCVTAAVRQADATKVRLTLSPGAFGSGNTYTVEVKAALTDLAGNTMTTPRTATFTGSSNAPSTAPNLSVASDTGSSSTDDITGFGITFPSPGLVFTGTVAANTTVVIYDNGVVVGSTTSDSSGSYSVTATATPAPGQYTVATVSSTGVVSDSSPVITITFDNTASAAPGIPVLKTTSDSGISSADRLTNSTTPTYTVSCVNGESVQLYDGGTATGAAGTCALGTVDLTAGTPPLSVGAHAAITAKQTDTAGNQSVASGNALTLNINTTPATILTSSVDTVSNRYIQLDFSEGVYGSATSSTAVTSTAAFTISTSGGVATAAINCVTDTASTTCPGVAPSAGDTSIRVQLTITGVPNGSELITVTTAANAVYDDAGNASSTNTGGKALNAAGIANLTGGAYTALGATGSTTGYVTVNFANGAYTNAGPAGALVAADFAATMPTTGNATAVASIDCVTTTAAASCAGPFPVGNETSVRVFLTFNATPNGTETVQLNPASSTAIYGTGGATPATSNTGALAVTDKLAPVISAVSPATSAFVTNTQVSYTNSETCAAGAGSRVTWTRTGGTADGAAHQINLAGSELTAGTHTAITLTNQDALVSGAVYTVAFTCTDAAGNTATTVSSTSVTYDTTAPTVTGVTSSTANGSYKAGQTVNIDVTFSEQVTLTGTPQITLETGTTDAVVDCPAGGPAVTHTCVYTIAAGHTTSDLDYINTSALALNGGTIKDAAGNNATLTLPATGGGSSIAGTKAIVIDTTAPTVTNVTASTANGAYKQAQTVTVQVTFSEAVTLTGTPQITLETGTTDAVVNCTAGGPATTHNCVYTIGAGHTSTDLEYQSTGALALNGGTINDAAANAATLTLPTLGGTGSLGLNKDIVIDTTVPTVTNITSSTANGTYGTGALISIQVTFSEVVNVVGSPTLLLETGTTDRNATYSSGTGTNILSFDYTVVSGDTNADLDYQSTAALNAGTTIRDAALNDATLTLPALGGAGSLALNKDINIAANVTFSITAAETMDCDPVDGIIDHYKITFGAAARDNTFDGYVVNSEGLPTGKWAVAGRSNARLHHGSSLPAACGTDTANDTVVYIKFNQGASVDTGVTPDLTGTNDTLAANSDGVTKLFSNTGNWVTTDVTESDKAGPFVYFANAAEGGASEAAAGAGDTLVLRFSERMNAAVLNAVSLDTIFQLNNGHTFGVAANTTSVWTTTTFTNDTLTITFVGASSAAVADTIKLINQATLLDNASNQAANPTSVTSPAVIGGTFEAGQVGPAITSATYLDTDANGYIDTVRVVFDMAVRDDSFPGYIVNNTGSVTTAWSVAGYNNVRLIHGTAVTFATDTANDTTIYLRFAEGSTYDTGVKPDLTATDQSLYGPFGGTLGSTACYVNTSVGAANCSTLASSDVLTANVVEADGALPLIIKATAKVGSTSVFISFSENVWSDSGLLSCGAGGQIVAGDFSYPVNSDGTPDAITGIAADNCATGDGFVEATANALFASGDLNADKISAASGTSLYDGAGNAMTTTRQQVIAEATAPYVLSASTYYSSALTKYYARIFFSEGVSNASAATAWSALRAQNYTVAYSSGTACPSFVATQPAGVTAVGGSNRVFDLETDPQCTGTIFKVTASTSIKDNDEFENVATPNFAYAAGTFSTDATKPRLLLARSLSATTVELTYSEPMVTGTGATSAECASTAVCATNDVDTSVGGTQAKYWLTPTGLGNVSSVAVTADKSVFVLTHPNSQSGNFYTVNVYATSTGSAIPKDSGGSNDLETTPGNQAVFQGAGTPILTFSDGAVFNDPFSDGTKFNFAFTYQNKVYLGPNDKNNAAFRFEADGLNPVGVSFLTTGGGTCTPATSFGIASGTCGAQTTGPTGERGIVSFTSGTVTVSSTDYEVLLLGPLKDGVTKTYFTQDVDTQLDWNICGFSVTGGGNTKSIQSSYAFAGNDKYYSGFSSDHSQQAPILAATPMTAPGGVLTCGSGSDLTIRSQNFLGKQGSPTANPAKTIDSSAVVGIDSMLYVATTPTPAGTFYIANNGGVASATTPFTSFTTNVTQTNFGGTTLVLPYAPAGLEKVRPGQKGMPVMAIWNGAIYAARNLAVGATSANQVLNAGGELWKCTGTCGTSTNWKKVLSTTDVANTFSNRANLTAISLLQVNGSYLYIGFDNPTAGQGAQIYRSQSGITEIDGTTACTGGDTTANNGDGYRCFVQQGTSGFGIPSENQYFFSSASIRKGSQNFIYVTVGDANLVAIKVLRQVD